MGNWKLLGHYNEDGSWTSNHPLFRDLTPEEVAVFQRYAEEHAPPSMDTSTMHPVCRDVWERS